MSTLVSIWNNYNKITVIIMHLMAPILSAKASSIQYSKSIHKRTGQWQPIIRVGKTETNNWTYNRIGCDFSPNFMAHIEVTIILKHFISVGRLAMKTHNSSTIN